VGFNPHRTRRRSVWDYVFVAAAVVAAALLLAWGLFG
jgi:hypothetical protein